MLLKTTLHDSASTFLLDTGSEISIFKKNCFIDFNELDNTDIFNLQGIGEGKIPTIGAISATIFLNNCELQHKFHIVEENFPIPCEGIIGYDFVKKFNCDLNYVNEGRSWCIIRPDFKFRVPVEIWDAPKPNTLVIPARAEVIRRVNITASECEAFIPTQTLANGVFVGNAIVSTKNAFVRIINTTDEILFLEKYSIKSESLNSYYQVSFKETENNKKREATILNKLSKNCAKHMSENLMKLCKEYTDIFALETDKISYNNFYKQNLRLKDNTPTYVKNYRLPHAYKPEINRQIQKMISDDIIEPSASEYNSPILLVPKKELPGSTDKRWRLVIDYRQLNKKLVADKYPLPRIDDILDELGRAKYFCNLDLISGFHQIELDENSRDITSFSSDQGSFRFKRLPFGLKISPNSFQRMMSLAFSGLGPNRAFVYMDDLIVIGCSTNHMLSNLKAVFDICRKTNLKLHPDKCSFFNSEVTFLGHKCTNKGILPDDSKFEKIKNYPKPTNADEAKRFIAFVNYYRRFIPNFANYAIHITRLTRKNTPFIWNNDCENAFQYLKKSLLSPKILKYPDYEKQFCITTDASKIACGAVLSQDYNGIQLPVAFASRSFTKGESNKSVIEQELTAIHWAINFFKPYIFGKKFLVKSDHKPLTYLFSLKNPSSKLTRMRLDLEEFDFDIEFIKGKHNCGADALSRIDFGQIKRVQEENTKIYQVTTRSKTKPKNMTPQKQPQKEHTMLKIFEVITAEEVKTLPCIKLIENKSTRVLKIFNKSKTVLELNLESLIVHEKIALAQFFSKLEKLVGNTDCKHLKIAINDKIFNYVDIIEFKKIGNEQLKKATIAITPAILKISSESQKLQILKKFHDDPVFGGHPGVSRFLSKIKRFYTWKNITKDVREYVKKCAKCQLNKSRIKNIEPLIKTATPIRAFDVIQIDTVGPLPKSFNNNEYAVTIICDLTKFLIAVPIPNKSAREIAKAVVENCILIHGPIRNILTDMGTEYKNEIFKELCQLLKIEHKTSTPYHHQTLGSIERSHKTLNEYLRSYLDADKTNWDECLKFFAYAYNTTPSSTHGYTPFELVYGKTPPSYDFLATTNVEPLYNIENYSKELRFKLQIAQKRANELLEKAKNNVKKRYDLKSYPQTIQVNDMVYLRDESSHKLDSVYKGPYQVLEVDEQNNCIIKMKNKKQAIHKNRLRKM